MQYEPDVCPYCKKVIREPKPRYPPDKDCYKPEGTLVSYLTKLASEEEDLDRTLSEEEQKEQKKKRQNVLKSKKHVVLNKHIFPSMANLTLFFTLVATSPKLRGLFDEDIQALFFGGSQEDVNHEYVFNRFIRAVLAVDSDTLPDDFRFALIDMTQREIYNRVTTMGSGKLSSDFLLNNVLYPDMGRAFSWTNSFAIQAYHNISFDKDRRPVLF